MTVTEVSASSYAGTTDLEKMRAAMADQASNPRGQRATIRVDAGSVWWFQDNPLELYDGFSMRVGTAADGEWGDHNSVACGGAGSVFKMTADTTNCTWSDVTFVGLPDLNWMEPNLTGNAGYVLQYSNLVNVSFSVWASVLHGRILGLHWSGPAYVNNTYGEAFRLWGSDNVLWSDGLIISSPQMAATESHITGEWLEKTYIGRVFVTGTKCTPILWKAGIASVLEGVILESATSFAAPNLIPGAALRVENGSLTVVAPFFYRAMNDPTATGRNDAGVVHVEGGFVQLVSPTFAEDGTSGTYAHVHVAPGAVCQTTGGVVVDNLSPHNALTSARCLVVT